MAKKLMIMPSARSRYVKDENMKLIYSLLLFISAIMIVTNWYMYGFMYGLKLVLMILVGLFITREMEILFYTHDKDIDRAQAKELIQKSYYKVTALLFILLIPVGTPLWLTGVGAIIATLLGKLLFGGFHHMVFHSSLVGYIFLTEGWRALVSGVKFTTAFDNYLLNLIFNNDFFNNTLYIGRLFGEASPVFNVDTYQTALSNTSSIPYSMEAIMLGLVPGITVSGLVLLGMLLFMIIKKTVNFILPITIIGSFLVTAFIIGDFSLEFVMYQLFSGMFLFVVVFITTDPITTPIPTKGKIIFGVIAGALTMIIRNGVQYEEGVVFAVLFMMMLTPMLNQMLKKKPVKKVPKKDVGA